MISKGMLKMQIISHWNASVGWAFSDAGIKYSFKYPNKYLKFECHQNKVMFKYKAKYNNTWCSETKHTGTELVVLFVFFWDESYDLLCLLSPL